ncbi:MAG TPA: hypothetical protein VJA94_00310 [Candidatus Angelobacter sp.]
MSRPERPVGVVVLSVLWTVAAILLLLAAWEMSNGMLGGQKAPSWLAPELVQRAPYLAIFGVAFGIVAFGLWDLQNWARITVLICSSIDLVFSGYTLVGAFAAGATDSAGFWILMLRTAIDATICVYLMRDVVAKIFQESW